MQDDNLLKMIRWVFGLILVVVGAIIIVSTLDAQDELIRLEPPEFGVFDAEAVEAIDITELAILPELTETARQIYQQSMDAGRNPHVFSKVGDCMTATHEHFLGPFASEVYDLGAYSELQTVIDYFDVPARAEGFELNSFANPGLATTNGFNSASVQDAIWADPNWCRPNESPLTCEYRTSNAAYALVMFGTNDVMFFEPDLFDFYMRGLIVETVNSDIVPILYTIPTRPEFPEKTIVFNQIIANIAQDYDLPLVNLWAAIQELPNEGVDELEPIHLSIPDGSAGDFSEENLQAGYTVRNLITLQTLDAFVTELTGAEADVQ